MKIIYLKTKKLPLCIILCTILSFLLIGSAYAATKEETQHTTTEKWYEISGKINSSWGGNIAGEIILKNISDETIRQWKIMFPWEVSITSMWNGTYENLGNWYAIYPAGYNTELAPGASVSVGFLAQGSDDVLKQLGEDGFFTRDGVKITHEGEREQPEESTSPKESNSPEETTIPDGTESPEESAVPEVTKKPDSSELPEETKQPEKSESPAVTSIPEGTELPESSLQPEETENPQETKLPEETTSPEVTQPSEEDKNSAKKYEYDSLNRLVAVVYEDGSEIHYSYDKNGNITQIKTIEAEQ